MAEISAREFGQLETEVKHLRGEVENLVKTLDTMAGQIREMRDAMAQAKGGWKTVMTLVSISGAIGALIAKFYPAH
jgi:chromosome condensin MukBEF ATPase and DNA-binding subunit MukB